MDQTDPPLADQAAAAEAPPAEAAPPAEEASAGDTTLPPWQPPPPPPPAWQPATAAPPAPQAWQPATAPPPAQAWMPAPGAPPPTPPSRSKGKLIALVVILLVVAGSVVGVVVATSGGKGKPVSTTLFPTVPTSPTGPTSAPTVDPPQAFLGTASVSPLSVTLSWLAPSGGGSVHGFTIYRDTVQIASVDATTQSYVDADVVPGESYTYEILTNGEGSVQSERASVQVDVPFPPLTDARLVGTYNVKAVTTSQYGYIGALGTFHFGWKFTPKCDTGACSVTWKDLHYKQLKTTLKLSGKKYTGSDSGNFFGTCNGVPLPTTVTIVITITKAKVVDGVWTVKKFTGTLDEAHKASSLCTSGGASFVLSGSLLG